MNASGDGFLAMFDGPQRAIRCAMAIRDAVQSLGIEVRAGLHTGECEVRGDDIGGIAVHIGARVSALAGPNDVLVSSTLRDLVIGSDSSSTSVALTNSKACPANGISSPSPLLMRSETVLGRYLQEFGRHAQEFSIGRDTEHIAKNTLFQLVA